MCVGGLGRREEGYRVSSSGCTVICYAVLAPRLRKAPVETPSEKRDARSSLARPSQVRTTGSSGGSPVRQRCQLAMLRLQATTHIFSVAHWYILAQAHAAATYIRPGQTCFRGLFHSEGTSPSLRSLRADDPNYRN